MKLILLLGLCATPALLLCGADKNESATAAGQVVRDKYLVNISGCNDCHTPLKITDKGPVPDMTRMLSGHPENTKLPPPDLKPGCGSPPPPV